MKRLFLLSVALLCLCACPSSPPETSGGPSSCTKDEECVLSGGDLCNPCGSCPGGPLVAMTTKELKTAIDAPECAERLGRGRSGGVAPNCGPCPAPPEGAPPSPTRAVCASGKCTAAN